MWLLLACAAPPGGTVEAPPTETADDTDSADTTGDCADSDRADTDSADGAAALELVLDPFPYVEVGDVPPNAALHLHNPGAAPIELDWALTGPFTAAGSTAALAPGEERVLALAWTGDTAAPTLAAGSVHAGETTLPLAVVVGDPALGRGEWVEDTWGAHVVLDLPSAPFAGPGAPYDDASVLIAVPSAWEPEEVAVVTHLHGFYATVEEVDAAQSLHAQLGLSGRGAVLVVPQGPVEAADGDFGQLTEPGGHARLVRDVLSVLYRDGWIDAVAIGPQVLSAHSGGYDATAEIVEQGGLPVDVVHLYDALYARADTFADFVVGGGVFRSVYTAGGGTDTDNEALRRRLVGDGVEVCEGQTDAELARCRVTIVYSGASHDGCVSEERAYARWLAFSGLPPAEGAAPVLRSALARGGGAAVAWREEGVTVVVEGSTDGERWTEIDPAEGAWPYLRVRQPGGAPSDVYAASGAAWLVVDGFDRVLGGSWGEPTHDFAARVAAALPGGASVVWHEAVAEGEVSLGDYERVVWLLGDESVADVTFDARERAAIEAWSGERLVLSGSEVGYADDGWLEERFGVGFVADDAGTGRVEGWEVGARYPEDYPDVLSGPEVVWRWSTGGAAAVRSGPVLVIGFGLENLSTPDLAAAAAELDR